MTDLWFATSNDHKAAEAAEVFRSMGLGFQRIQSKGEEVRSDDPATVARVAAQTVAANEGKPVFVEDTALRVHSLNGFPGTYSSYVFRTIGLAGMLRLMEHKEREAEFLCAVGFSNSGDAPEVFTGTLKGSIPLTPVGSKGFGFDPIFIPEGSTVSLGEMGIEEKCRISHRGIALRSFAHWLEGRYPRQGL